MGGGGGGGGGAGCQRVIFGRISFLSLILCIYTYINTGDTWRLRYKLNV